MGRGPSWRLRFIDIDSSFTINTSASEILGYMVVRAPKGNIEPMYFTPQNEAAIHAMIGIPTADWPDINEAIAFNREYGIYISAPPGTSEEYPSYYGGAYITKNGIFPMSGVTDKDEPGYMTALALGQEAQIGARATTIEVEALSDTNQGIIKINNVTNRLRSSLANFDFSYWGGAGQGADAGRYTYQIGGMGLQANRIYCLADGEIAVDNNGNAVICGTYDAEANTIMLGGVPGATNNANHAKVPYIDFSKLIDDVEYRRAMTFINNPDTEDEDRLAAIESLKAFIATGATPKVDNIEFTPILALQNKFFWNINLKNDTYMYIIQKTPTEKVTQIDITNIGYHKFRFDMDLEYLTTKSKEGELTTRLCGIAGDLEKLSESNDFFKPLDDNSLALGLIARPGRQDKSPRPQDYYAQIYQYEEYEDEGKIKVRWNNVTQRFRTQVVRARTSFENKLKLGDEVLEVPASAVFDDTLWVIDDMVRIDGRNLPAGRIHANPQPDINFNTITFNISEEVYPGRMTSGGSFHGSLSETGKDSYGANIFFPQVLPDDALSFVEVRVNKTFDGDVNDKGFFTGAKLIDKIGPGANFTQVRIQGTRYVNSIVNDNIRLGTVGCAWRNEFYPLCNDGWIEAANTKYDECYIFMEPTGQEIFKATLSSLRTTHKLSTMISPKIIDKGEFLNPSTIAVAGRMTGTAQYVGEFLLLCPYTSKRYWCQPIGDVGVNLARIIQLRLGGWAPMWNNITGGLGGQLSRSVLKAKWDFNDRATQILDEKGLNPIIFNADDGLMIVSQKTTQDPMNTTDWSYLGHTMSFDLCKREIRDNVMRAQIGKPNDEYWQNIRQQQVDAILAKRITGSQPIWAAAVCDIAGQNNDIVKAQRKFVIKVQVKVNIFSEIVELVFENVAQTTNL